MKKLVVYKSETGFTQKYAEWIAEALECQAVDLKSASKETVESSDVVIFGGSLAANAIQGYSKISDMKIKNLIIYAVGYAKDTESIRKEIVKRNHIQDKPFFYMRGGVNYERLNFIKRALMKAIAREAKSADYTKKTSIDDLIKYVNAL